MLPAYRTILYASDLSANAAHAFRHAVALARHFDARIDILHVLPEVEPAVLNYVATVMGEDRLADMELRHKSEVHGDISARIEAFALEELREQPEDRQRIGTIRVHHGSPVARILSVADEVNADLIVLGSHGKARLHYTFLGSVAEKVLHRSKRPVLVVPLATSNPTA